MLFFPYTRRSKSCCTYSAIIIVQTDARLQDLVGNVSLDNLQEAKYNLTLGESVSLDQIVLLNILMYDLIDMDHQYPSNFITS